jgi:hypothetical protein
MVPANASTQGRRRTRIIRRRRQTFTRLLVIAISLLILGLIPRLHVLLLAHAAADLAVAVYVWRLLTLKQREHQRARVVRPLLVEDERSGPGTGAVAQSG